jgi:hypothetical protein
MLGKKSLSLQKDDLQEEGSPPDEGQPTEDTPSETNIP